MPALPCLRNRSFQAFIADNSPCGVHRAGYNGVASLIPHDTGNNVFVPLYAGLNYEVIWLGNLPRYRREDGFNFEPRCEPMQVEEATPERVVLVQPETSHSHVSARITFRVEEPHYLHQRVELAARRRFAAEGAPCALTTLWASYIHMPRDRHIYAKPDHRMGPDLDGWFGLTRQNHHAPDWQVALLPDGRELTAADHLRCARSAGYMTSDDMEALPEQTFPRALLPFRQDAPLSFYYGLLDDGKAFLMMFRQPGAVRLAYSPCGGGQEPAWSPAWDYLLHVEDCEPGRTYAWDLCLAVMPFAGRMGVLDEVRRYLAG